MSKTEFISCPSCGRTLFNLQTTTERIKSRMSHLKDVKIAIMGCIVNGPGEMADADFGYVGSGPGKLACTWAKSVSNAISLRSRLTSGSSSSCRLTADGRIRCREEVRTEEECMVRQYGKILLLASMVLITTACSTNPTTQSEDFRWNHSNQLRGDS